ncbi:hypothetical protein F4825DRAFT_451467 [Nemania diffusa]|nr:hypothetical protein F4825DRAFT_451467 [Nemania diffusa]
MSDEKGHAFLEEVVAELAKAVLDFELAEIGMLCQAEHPKDVGAGCSFRNLCTRLRPGSSVPVIARGEGDLVLRNDLKGFVPRILKLGRDNKLAPRFGEIGRAQAPLARWEAIGNGVAWKMDAVDQVQATKHCQHIITIAP